MSLAAGLALWRLGHYAAVTVLFGGLLFDLYGRPRTAGTDRRLSALAAASAWAAAITGLGWLAWTTAAMNGDLSGAGDPRLIAGVLTDTDFGRLWMVRLGLAALAVVLVSLRAPRVPALATATLLLASLAGTGHALSPEGPVGWAHAALDAAHLLAAGAWLGALAPLGWMVAAAGRRGAPEDAAASAAILARFSFVGITAVAVLVASGAASSWLLLGGVQALWRTGYGRLLMVKLLAFAVMLGLAAANRYRLTPTLAAALGDGPATAIALGRLKRSILAEQALGLVVLAVVAVLGTLAPPVDGG